MCTTISHSFVSFHRHQTSDMADFVSPLSIRALLQDVNMNPSSSFDEPNYSMVDEAAMNRAYYMGLQSSQPTACPLPLEVDPLAGKPPGPAWSFQQILA